MRTATDNAARPPVVVLASGGLDSTTALSHFVGLGYSTTALFIEFGQASQSEERLAVAEVARFFDVQLRVVEVNGLGTFGQGITLARNLFLLSTAAMAVGTAPALIAIGVHSGTGYPDCSAAFLSSTQAVLDFYASGALRISAPFLEWSKADIYRYAIDTEVPIRLTYSCEAGQDGGCGRCPSCRDMEALRAST